jgi:two-component system chemotaxis sensor kinase CheA
LEIRSTPGRGTCFGVRLPLTLAIVDGLIVGIGSERYVLPFGFVAETLQVSPDAVVVVGGQARMIRVRGDYLPVIELGRVLGVPQAASDWCAGIMVVVEAHGMRAAVLVDSLIDQQQVVIKHLGDHFRRLPVFSAATVLGNGKVALIFDVAGLLERLRSGQTLAA